MKLLVVLAFGMASCNDAFEREHRAAAMPGLPSSIGSRCPKPTGVRVIPDDDSEDGHAALARVNHFVVIYMENRSFDSLYGLFPGADGLVDEQCKLTSPRQVDPRGMVYERLPGSTPFVDMPNRPFDIGVKLAPSESTLDLAHSFANQQAQINGGAMNKFVAYNGSSSLAVGFYDTMRLPMPQIALDFTVCDRFFHSAFGGSFLNHQWLISARTPVFPDAPWDIVQMGDPENPVPLDADGAFMGEEGGRYVTKDGYVVNTADSRNLPHNPGADLARTVPSQTAATIGDRLSEANLSWAWYAGGWNEVVAAASGGTEPLSASAATFQYHHQPFVYFENFRQGTPGREHLKDELDFRKAVEEGTLPAVSFVKPVGSNNEHPSYTNLMRGEQYAADLVRAIMAGPNWKDTAIIVTYDENGGFADHVAPPVIDRWGPGVRVPTLIISPHAKRNFVDHTSYETVSILATLERRFGLEPLSSRDANATDFAGAFTTRK